MKARRRRRPPAGAAKLSGRRWREGWGTAVTYHRVSTTDQDPTLARAELRRAVALRELALVEEIEETGSGARNDRPGLARVMGLAARGEISHVVCWRLDRFGRSTVDLLTNLEALTAAGVTFVCTSEMLDVGPRGGATGRLVMTVLASITEYERETIRQRTRLGVARARADGKRIGRPRALVDAQLAQLAQLAQGGASVRSMAAALGVERRTVRDRLAELAVKMSEVVPSLGSAPLAEMGPPDGDPQSGGSAPPNGVNTYMGEN